MMQKTDINKPFKWITGLEMPEEKIEEISRKMAGISIRVLSGEEGSSVDDIYEKEIENADTQEDRVAIALMYANWRGWLVAAEG